MGFLAKAQIQGTLPVYRFYNGNTLSHYYGTNPAPPSGYLFEAIIGYIFSSQQPNTTPLYWAYNATDT
jgi:hypothetical protein